MTIKKIKTEMLEYVDFYGGDLLGKDEIEAATTKQELADIIDRHRNFLEDMLCDAQSHLSNLRKITGLNMLS